MKANNLYNVFLLSLLCLLAVRSNAQEPLPCGTYKIDLAAEQKALDFEKSNANNPQAGNVQLQVYFHICACDNGTNPAARPTQIDSEFNTLVASYAADNICFLNAGYNYVYSTKLDTNFNVNTDDTSLFHPYRISKCINIFYMKKIKGTNNACSNNCGVGGSSLFIPNTFCLISNGNIGAGQSISHEVGHCMGLYHTFENRNNTSFEDIDGSNSSTTADLITDTPADPYAYNGQSCFSTSSNNCTYTGSCKDPKGKSNFSTPYTNLMTYWWNGNKVTCYSSLLLTSGQYTRVNSYLNTNSSLIACESQSGVTEGPNVFISSGYLVTSAINQFITTGTVSISGASVVTFGGQTVLLEPGFDAIASTGSVFLARVSACAPAFLAPEKADQDVNNNTDKNSLLIYPNPASEEINLVFTLNQPERKSVIEIYNTNMSRVKEMDLDNLNQGKQNIPVNLSELPSGVYIVVVKFSSSLLSTKMVLTK